MSFVTHSLLGIKSLNFFFFFKIDFGKISTLGSLLDSLLLYNKDVDMKLDEPKMKATICTTFVFCYVWAIGGNLNANSWDSFDTFVRNQFEDNSDAKVCNHVL